MSIDLNCLLHVLVLLCGLSSYGHGGFCRNMTCYMLSATSNRCQSSNPLAFHVIHWEENLLILASFMLELYINLPKIPWSIKVTRYTTFDRAKSQYVLTVYSFRNVQMLTSSETHTLPLRGLCESRERNPLQCILVQRTSLSHGVKLLLRVLLTNVDLGKLCLGLVGPPEEELHDQCCSHTETDDPQRSAVSGGISGTFSVQKDVCSDDT